MSEKKIGKLTYREINGGTAYIVTECEKDAVEVEIPAKVDGLPVTAVWYHAFENCTLLEKVTFPEPTEEDWVQGNTFDEIGDYAFSGCSSLKEVEIPYCVHTIGRGAFYDCVSLRKATFGDIFVGSYAFSGCKKLEEVSPVDYVNEGVFRFCESLKELPVTKDLKEIGEDAFEHCYGLTEITIPATTRCIEGLAFRSCRGLKRVVFEEPNGWVWHCRYTDKDYPLDLSDPERNAKSLGEVDFDDGVSSWRRE